jgi:AraC family transcriptional regulator
MAALLTDFPDLAWLKQQVAQRWPDRTAGQGWPTLILHTQGKASYRPNIQGPLLLFINLQGSSLCGTSGPLVRVDETSFFLSNRGEAYTLSLEPGAATETFNLHFGEKWAEDVLHTLTQPTDRLLDDPNRALDTEVAFHSQLYRRDTRFELLLRRLQTATAAGSAPTLLLDELLTDVLRYLMDTRREVLHQIQDLPFRKPATRQEIYRRLSRAVDYLHTAYQRDLRLDELAEVACLSRFHFLRLFRACYSHSPYHYLQLLRLQKAQSLLRHTRRPVSDIALELGFENLSSFSRLFRQRHGLSARQYRLTAAR